MSWDRATRNAWLAPWRAQRTPPFHSGPEGIVKIKNETVVCVAFVAASVLCVVTGHVEAAYWFGVLGFFAWFTA